VQTSGLSNFLSQTLTTNLQANDTYTVKAYVGLRADAYTSGFGCSGFNISLLAGGNVLNTLLISSGNVSCSAVAYGTFSQLSFTYTSGSNPTGLGSPLQILLTVNGSGSDIERAEVDFDEITLTDTAGP
jgi:hypothetical protein